MSTTSLLRADSVEELRTKARELHGPAARVVSAEWVPASGFGRWRTPRHVEGTVEIPDIDEIPVPLEVSTASRIGIAALLADADDAQDRLAGMRPTERVAARTTEGFDDIMAQLDTLTATTSAPATRRDGAALAVGVDAAPDAVAGPFAALAASTPPPTPPPAPPRVPGDLVVVVGLTSDVLKVTQGLAKAFGPGEVRAAGTMKTRGRDVLTDRRTALLARAEGVEHGKVVFCAFGFDAPDDLGEAVAALDADQVWAVVDAGRKPDDTSRWVAQLSATAGVTALAVVGAASTATPETVHRIGPPIGWCGGSPTTSSRL